MRRTIRQAHDHELASAYEQLGVGTQCTHAVQFYEDDRFLVASIGDFLATGLAVGQRVLAVATASHRQALRTHLEQRGFDVDRALVRGQLTLVDAEQLLKMFMVGARPDTVLFHAALGRVFRGLEMPGTPHTVRVFGEMVDVLCRSGNVAGAMELESLWNELARTEKFSLLCAYSLANFREATDTSHVASICGQHAHVFPTEHYTQKAVDDRHREIALLQQRAHALATEVERSRELEQSLREALARAETANRAKSEFLAMMSHELRTPLNAIGGHVQLVELELHGPINERQREALRRVQRSQRHLLALINDVLNLARAESATLEFSTEAVLVAPLVQEVTEMLSPLFGSMSLSCGVAIEEDELAPITVRADREKVHQVLLNLLGNALKFTPPGGAINVRVTCPASPDASVQIDVVDSGIGIPTDKLEQIFQPFVQLGRWSMEPRDGIGLGLSISRALARGMGGDLAAASMPGLGSTLTLTLPRS